MNLETLVEKYPVFARIYDDAIKNNPIDLNALCEALSEINDKPAFYHFLFHLKYSGYHRYYHHAVCANMINADNALAAFTDYCLFLASLNSQCDIMDLYRTLSALNEPSINEFLEDLTPYAAASIYSGLLDHPEYMLQAIPYKSKNYYVDKIIDELSRLSLRSRRQFNHRIRQMKKEIKLETPYYSQERIHDFSVIPMLLTDKIEWFVDTASPYEAALLYAKLRKRYSEEELTAIKEESQVSLS